MLKENCIFKWILNALFRYYDLKLFIWWIPTNSEMRNLQKFTHAPSQMLSGTQQTDLNFSCGPLYLFLAICLCLNGNEGSILDQAPKRHLELYLPISFLHSCLWRFFLGPSREFWVNLWYCQWNFPWIWTKISSPLFPFLSFGLIFWVKTACL